MYESLQQVLPPGQLQLCVGLDKHISDIKGSDLILLDEADDLLFTHELNPPKKCKGIIAVSATTKSIDGASEDAFLKMHDFEIMSSGI